MAGAVAYLASPTDIVDRSTYTFSAASLGSAASDRVIIVAVMARSGTGTTPAVNSVTVDGISATNVGSVVQTGSSTANHNIVSMWQAEVPSGTSGDVVVVFNRTMARCTASMYRATDISVAAPSTDSDAVPDGTLTVSASVTEATDGIVVGAACAGAASSATWSGLTEDADFLVEGFFTVTPASGTSSSSGSRAVSATFGSTGTGGTSGAALLVAAFGPPGSGSAIQTRRRRDLGGYGL